MAKLRLYKIISKLKSVKPLERIVDLGSGYNGRSLEKIIKLFPEIKTAVGADLSVGESSVNPKIKLIAADLNKALPLSGESFDAAICTAVIEHLPDPESAIGETFRILKPGGSFILTTPSPLNKKVVEFLAFRLGLLDKTEIVDHKNYFTPTELKKMMSRSGFKKIEIKTFQLGCNILVSCNK